MALFTVEPDGDWPHPLGNTVDLVDWRPDGKYLVADCGDYEVYVPVESASGHHMGGRRRRAWVRSKATRIVEHLVYLIGDCPCPRCVGESDIMEQPTTNTHTETGETT